MRILRYQCMKIFQFFIITIFLVHMPMIRLAVAETCEGVQRVSPDAVALQSITSLAIAGDAHAQAQLGVAYLHGRGVDLDKAKALSLFSQSAAAGDSEGQYLLGKYYVDNGKTDEDFRKAAGWLKQSADQGCLPALFYLGLITSHGKGVPKDTEDGVRMITKAAEAGYTQAQVWLGTILISGEGVSKDTKAGFNWTKRAADAGDTAAEISLANLYLLGIGTPKNPAAAQSLLESVYSKNDHQAPKAAYFLGWMYMEGQGVPVDTVKALSWMIIAANAQISDSEQRREILTEQLPKKKLEFACSVYMAPLPTTNSAEEYVRANAGETVVVLSLRASSFMVYFPERPLVGFIHRKCSLNNWIGESQEGEPQNSNERESGESGRTKASHRDRENGH